MDRRNAAKGVMAALGGSLLVASSRVAAQDKSAPPPPAPVGGEGNLARIQRTKTLRVAGLVGEEPYFSKDLASGQWSGFCIEMARDIAKELDSKLEIVESTWGNSVLDLQSNKIDISFGLNPTPKRALVVDFSAPLFFNSFVIVTSKKFKARTWRELNDPKVRIAVDLGSSHELVARRFAPNATITALKNRDEAILAVQSGRADCFVATVFLGLTALKKNPQLGMFVIPQPPVQSAVSAAFQYDNDRRFRDFMTAWANFNRGNGQTKEWILTALAKQNIKPEDVPPEMTF